MGEYNAVADTLEIINDTIRFQGKAGGLLEGERLLSCSPALMSSEDWGQAQSPWLCGKRQHPLLSTHVLAEHTVPIIQLWGWVTGTCRRAGFHSGNWV